jgi:hypothetical protein
LDIDFLDCNLLTLPKLDFDVSFDLKDVQVNPNCYVLGNVGHCQWQCGWSMLSWQDKLLCM